MEALTRAPDEEVCEVIVTAPDGEWLADLTHRLIAENLCACGHHIAPIRAVYRWRGRVYDQTETRVALHTRRSLLPRLTARIEAEHPYEVPCIIALPITGGSDAYIRWILDETAEPTHKGIPLVCS